MRSMQQLLQEGQAEKDELRKQLAAEKWACRNLEQEVLCSTFDSPVLMHLHWYTIRAHICPARTPRLCHCCQPRTLGCKALAPLL